MRGERGNGWRSGERVERVEGRGRSDETTERQEKGGRKRGERDETMLVKWMRRAKERGKERERRQCARMCMYV